MSAANEITLAELRKAVSRLERRRSDAGVRLFRFGSPALDAALGGGLVSGALHEVYARRSQDGATAAGFGLGLALRAADRRPLVWVRQDFAAVETGEFFGEGLAAFGLDPKRLLVVRAHDPTSALRAAHEAAHCSAVGATLVQIWGEPKVLNLRTSRRLTLAAEASGATLVMIRLGASPVPSSAASRWSVAAAASTPLEANAPGRPAFYATLLRHRSSLVGRAWRLEWDRDRTSFSEPAALSRPLASVPAGRPDAADGAAPWLRAG